MHYILFYEYAPDYLERRGEFRDQHIALAKASIDRGELFLGGAFASCNKWGQCRFSKEF